MVLWILVKSPILYRTLVSYDHVLMNQIITVAQAGQSFLVLLLVMYSECFYSHASLQSYYQQAIRVGYECDLCRYQALGGPEMQWQPPLQIHAPPGQSSLVLQVALATTSNYPVPVSDSQIPFLLGLFGVGVQLLNIPWGSLCHSGKSQVGPTPAPQPAWQQ